MAGTSVQNRAKTVAPYAARSLSLRLSGSVSESFGGLTSLQAAPEAAAACGAAIMRKTTCMLVCHILAITKLVRLVKGPLLLASKSAHQRFAQDSVVHQNIRGLQIYTFCCTCAAPRSFFTFTGASTPSETLTGQKKDTSGDDTPAGPQRGPRHWPFRPRELLRDRLRVTRRRDITPCTRAGRVAPSRAAS